MGFLDRFLYLDFKQLRLLPDFGSAEPTVKDHVSFRVTARAYAIVFTLLRVLYAFWREKVLDVFIWCVRVPARTGQGSGSVGAAFRSPI